MRKISIDFYQRSDVIKIAKELIGKILITKWNGIETSGRIVEVEAYNGIVDKASHASGGRRTNRNEVMYGRGGMAYVYLCYGIHHLFNVVTHEEGTPHAVLVRAIIPVEGMELMRRRRGAAQFTTGGPGTLTEALAIRTTHSGSDLLSGPIGIEDHGVKVTSRNIVIGPRIGVQYAGKDALRPYRFRLAPDLVASLR